MKYILITNFLLIFGCNHTLPFKKTHNKPSTENGPSPNEISQTIIVDPSVDYINPMLVFGAISLVVLFISFFPFFYAAYSFLKKKILTLFGK